MKEIEDTIICEFVKSDVSLHLATAVAAAGTMLMYVP